MAHEDQQHQHGREHGDGHGHGHGHGVETDFAGMAEFLDLDAEVFGDYLDDVAAAVGQSLAGTPVRRIADLGCGTGAGTFALAGHFPDAELYAVDAAQPLLDHVAAKARARDLAGSVRPLHADLDGGWPAELHDLDLVWASASVHHLADPPRGLARIRSTLAPGGLLALIEIDDVMRFFPAFLPPLSAGSAGPEEAARAAALPDMLAAMPYLQAGWGTLLAEAGFTVTEDRVFDVTLRPPLPAATGRLAQLALGRAREQLRSLDREDDLSAEDLALLDELVGDGPGGVAHRADLVPRVRRRLWLARSPVTRS
jgi:SAM-dependent methyltransferase